MGKGVAFIVDQLTNSIVRVDTGISYETEVLEVSREDMKYVLKRNGWQFNWKKEFNTSNHKLFKLVLRGETRVQGLISLEAHPKDDYIEMHLIENAPHNMNEGKQFTGVASNLVAFGCRLSFEMGFEGYVAFVAKTKLIDHYRKKLGAQVIIGHNRMAIFGDAAKKLVNSYYKNFFNV